jgi:hypothetical protein
MNERFKKLAEQCRIETYGVNGELLAVDFDEQKFAELIVQDCRDMFVVNSVSWNLLNEKLEHFGVEE